MDPITCQIRVIDPIPKIRILDLNKTKRLSEPHERDAEITRNVLFRARVDLNTLIEVVCTHSSSELRSVKQAYRSCYNSDIEQDVSIKFHGDFKEILIAILKSSRNYAGKVDMSRAMCDAKTLYEAMESGKYVDQKTIISLISQRSSAQLKSILDSYKQLYGNELSKSLKRNKSERTSKSYSNVYNILRSTLPRNCEYQ